MSVYERKREVITEVFKCMTICVGMIFCLVRSSNAQDQPAKDLAGFGFGIGIATNFDVGGRRVATANVVNNVVRVEDSSSNASVSFVLEAHYFLMSRRLSVGERNACANNYPGSWINCTELAHGPFVAVEIGGGNSATTTAGPITGYALGWMVGMRHPNQTPASSMSWNFGVGLRVTPNAKRLGDGLFENQPLTPGDTIRFKTEPRYGVMLMSGFSF